jgi:hypothetical protein
MSDHPLIRFYPLIRAPASSHLAMPKLPERALDDASGSIPVSAFRFCEPLKAACSLGYYLYLPMAIGLMFDGSDIVWSWDQDGTGIGAVWEPLHGQVGYPGFEEDFTRMAPAVLRGRAPPLLVRDETRGMVQIWTGVIMKTRPGWSLLVRGPVNDIRHSRGYVVMEGIIQTDRWHGHLFANVQLLHTHRELLITAHQPFVQVIPVHRAHYKDELLNDFTIESAVPVDIWRGYAEVIAPHAVGRYAVAARQRRAAERQQR